MKPRASLCTMERESSNQLSGVTVFNRAGRLRILADVFIKA
jgi:hypothetical protein